MVEMIEITEDPPSSPGEQTTPTPDEESPDDGELPATTVSTAESKKKKKKKKQNRKKDSRPGQEQQSPSRGGPSDAQQSAEHLSQINGNVLPTVNATVNSNKKSSVADLLRHLRLVDEMSSESAKKAESQDMASHKFWSTQPVPRFDEPVNSEVPDGPLEQKGIDSVPKEPAPLLEGFEWVTMDVKNEDQMRELYELLNGHYVEDVGANFRFDYSPALLNWALMPPGWRPEWHVGVRASTSRKLVAFISATPVRVRVRNQTVLCSEVNFLCVHKKLRNKRLAPVLIKEVTRRSNLQGIWQGLYTGGTLLPTPIATCRYYHRAINWQKLHDTGFSVLPGDSRPHIQIRRFAVPDTPSLPGFREMRPADLDSVLTLLARYLARFDLTPDYSRKELEHWLLNSKRDPKEPRCVWAYVVEGENKEITDLISFYCLESLVINKNVNIRAAYLFYVATDSGLDAGVAGKREGGNATNEADREALRARLVAVVNDGLVMAKQARFDVLNALTLMDNALFLERTKFRPGDGSLHYYLYNYRAKPISGGVTQIPPAANSSAAPAYELDEQNLSGIGLVML